MLSIVFIVTVSLIAHPFCVFFFNLERRPGEKKNKASWKLVLMGLFLLFTIYCSMKEGRDSAIKNAELLAWDDQGYNIRFGSEVHSYEWTGAVFYEGKRIH